MLVLPAKLSDDEDGFDDDQQEDIRPEVDDWPDDDEPCRSDEERRKYWALQHQILPGHSLQWLSQILHQR